MAQSPLVSLFGTASPPKAKRSKIKDWRKCSYLHGLNGGSSRTVEQACSNIPKTCREVKPPKGGKKGSGKKNSSKKGKGGR